jgi:hypothetical protein
MNTFFLKTKSSIASWQMLLFSEKYFNTAAALRPNLQSGLQEMGEMWLPAGSRLLNGIRKLLP